MRAMLGYRCLKGASLHRPRATAQACAAAAGKRVIALDFDGVVCDSVGESSLSAIKVCCMERWCHSLHGNLLMDRCTIIVAGCNPGLASHL